MGMGNIVIRKHEVEIANWFFVEQSIKRTKSSPLSRSSHHAISANGSDPNRTTACMGTYSNVKLDFFSQDSIGLVYHGNLGSLAAVGIR